MTLTLWLLLGFASVLACAVIVLWLAIRNPSVEKTSDVFEGWE